MSRLSISSSFLVYCHLRCSLDGILLNLVKSHIGFQFHEGNSEFNSEESNSDSNSNDGNSNSIPIPPGLSKANSNSIPIPELDLELARKSNSGAELTPTL